MATVGTRLIPTGECWCGCRGEAGIGSFFISGHDKKAEARVIAAEFGSVAAFVAELGYGPRGPKRAALERMAQEDSHAR